VIKILGKIKKLTDLLDKLLSSEFRNFQKRGKLDFSGVYAIYKGKKIIYIGSSKNIKKRIQELLADYRSHTLHRKLLCEKFFGNFGGGTRKRLDKIYKTLPKSKKEYAKNFFRKRCKFKLLEVKNEKAKYLEHFAIGVLNPRYNY